MHKREGMTQGDQLAVVTYGIGILLIIKWTKAEFTNVTKPCYTDDEGAFSRFANVELYFIL